MIRDIMTANETVTPNQKEINILKENFPSCFWIMKMIGKFDEKLNLYYLIKFLKLRLSKTLNQFICR